MTDFVESIKTNFVEIINGTVFLVSETQQGIQGIQGVRGDVGPPGGSLIQRVASTPLLANRFVVVTAAGTVGYAAASNAAHAIRMVGITTVAALSGAAVTVLVLGEVTDVTWNWNLTDPIFLGATGLPTQTAPASPSCAFSQIIGFPLSATSMFVKLEQAIWLS